MDMNWQTMLHEAANASFEKDIEVRSAADNDAYSCVDLPKAKIRELSEKILHLPHQGIVLLFSRYCFRLSPQETEKFFQMKNAKGRFRFYRELLSTSMGLSSEQVISDASLNRACKNDSIDLCGCQRDPWIYIHFIDYSDCILLS